MSHAAVKSFDKRGVSCKNARAVQFSGGVERCPVTRKTDGSDATMVELFLSIAHVWLDLDTVPDATYNSYMLQQESHAG